jgi:hypothetical protein
MSNLTIKQRVSESQLAMDSLRSGLKLNQDRVIKISFIDDDNRNQANFLAKDSQELNAVGPQLLAMDSADANFNTPSNGTPYLYSIAWSNEIVRQVTQKFAYKELASDYQQGDFITNAINFPTLAHSGEPANYGDNTNDGETNLNVNIETVDVIRKQVPISYGDLEVGNFASAKIDAIAEKREAAAIILAQTGNNIFFNGFAGKRIYGILNHPDLATPIPLPASAAVPTGVGASKWVNKTFEEIVKDLLLMYNDIIARAGNNVNIGDISQSMTLATTPEDQTYLLQPNSFGKTPFEFIKTTFAGLKLVSAIQYRVGNGLAGNKAQLILDKIASQKVVRNGFTYQLMAHRLVANTSSYNQKFSAGYAGAIVTSPIGISTATGV